MTSAPSLAGAALGFLVVHGRSTHLQNVCVQLNVVGAESEPKKLQLARRNGALLPSDDLQVWPSMHSK